MSNDFIHNSGRRSAKKKYTHRTLRKSAAMMSGALPSPPADERENATSTRKNAIVLSGDAGAGDDNANATPPSAQRPPATVEDDDAEDEDHTDEEAHRSSKKAVPAQRNAFTVLASSQAANKGRAIPAGRPPTQKWTGAQEWIVIEGIRDGLSQAQILLNLLPTERSASAIRGKKKELQEKYGEKMEKMAELPASSPRTPAPPMPLRKSWTSDESAKLRKYMMQGMEDRQIQALHFPNRTEDSVIGKIRKLRAADANNMKKRGARSTPFSSSKLKYVSSSPAAPRTSSQTITRSSPAQAAFKRKSEVNSDHLPSVQEEAAANEDEDELDPEREPYDEFEALDDFEPLQDVELEGEGVGENISPENAPLNDPEEADSHISEGANVSVTDDAKATSANEDVDDVQESNPEVNTIDEDIIPNSPIVSAIGSSPPTSHRTAYVVIPARPDLSDVVDLRAGPLVPSSARVNDREAKYAAIAPPFRPGEEQDRVGMLHSTKLGLWREAYARCRGDAEAAYRKYESLVTDDHMFQAVCNLDYEMINGIKAVRMRRAREDALREGRSPPITPVQEQPKHLDLYEKKDPGKYYSYKPWDKEVEALYLNEPLIFGPRPVPGEPIDYPDAMEEAMRDDGDDGDDDGGDDDYEEGDDNYQIDASHDEQERRPTRPGAAKPFHGHVSEIDEDDEDEVEDAKPNSVISSHQDMQADPPDEKTDVKEQSLAASPGPSPRKRKQSSTQEDIAPPDLKKQKKAKAQQHVQQESVVASPVVVREGSAEQQTQQPMQEESVKPRPTVKRSPKKESTLLPPPSAKEQEMRMEKEEWKLKRQEMKMKREEKMKRKQQEQEDKMKQERNLKKKMMRKQEQEEKMEKKMAAEAESMPPPVRKRSKANKAVPLADKKGAPMSKAALRRRRNSLLRSDASSNASTTSESIAEPPRAVVPQARTEAKPTKKVSTSSPVIVHTAMTDEDHHPEDNPSQWMRDIVKNAKHKPPPVRRRSPPPVDPNNLFGRGDPSDDSSSDSGEDE